VKYLDVTERAELCNSSIFLCRKFREVITVFNIKGLLASEWVNFALFPLFVKRG
jgi:hypothetical protein